MSETSIVFKNIHQDVVLKNVANNDIIDEVTPVPIDADEGISVETNSLVPLFNTPAYEVHVIATGVPSLLLFSVRLDLPSGFGRRRTDVIRFIKGAVTITDTFNKGFLSDKQALLIQKRNERRRGALFRYQRNVYVGILGSLGIEEVPDIAGFDLATSRELVCNREQFGNDIPIESQDELIIMGKKHLVDKVSERAWSVSFQLKQVED